MKLAKSISAPALLAATFALSAPTYGYAGALPPDLSVTVAVTPITTGGYDWDYTFTIKNPGLAYPIGAIEIPEVQSGDLQATLPLPPGWAGTEENVAAFADPQLKLLGQPPAWLYLAAKNPDDYIGEGNNPVSFNLFSTLGGSTPAQISTAYVIYEANIPFYDAASIVTIDPATPNSVPEPSTWALMVLGALGLVALRRRKDALAPVRF